jgi:vacuolar-type H+-ATPase subunit I/STV1
LIARLKLITPSPEIQELSVTRPPTSFDTNCYTAIAQEITDTYGVPRYEEINPAIFTTVTFPFFFGVMFGDIGHGLILFLLGLYLVFNNRALAKTQFAFACQLRYMVLMMGFFAVYCGWIYNDFLGMNLNIFGSCYVPIRDVIETDQYVPPIPDCVYPFGIDPIWGIANNELIFVNGLKMKISVIIAILHMTVGVVLRLLNSLYFKRMLEVIFEFIPMILFLVLLFGYMDFLIIYKWLTPWPCEISSEPGKPNSGIFCNPEKPPPSIISSMMDIGLQIGSTVLLLRPRKKQAPCGEKPAIPLKTPSRPSSSSSLSSAFPQCSSPNPASRSTG